MNPLSSLVAQRSCGGRRWRCQLVSAGIMAALMAEHARAGSCTYSLIDFAVDAAHANPNDAHEVFFPDFNSFQLTIFGTFDTSKCYQVKIMRTGSLGCGTANSSGSDDAVVTATTLVVDISSGNDFKRATDWIIEVRERNAGCTGGSCILTLTGLKIAGCNSNCLLMGLALTADPTDVLCGATSMLCATVTASSGNLQYDWDTDGDGIYDDAQTNAPVNCISPSFMQSTMVGVKVTDLGTQAADCFLTDNTQVTVGECEPPSGACCDAAQPNGSCQNDVQEADCTGDQLSWFDGMQCADLSPPCSEHIGACCDRRIADPDSRCVNNVPESQCNPTGNSQILWTKGTLCADLNPPCTEHTGACCNAASPGGSCTDGVLASLCDPNDLDPQVVWIKGVSCTNLTPPCSEHTGACCDASQPGGSCSDGVPESQCNPTGDPQITWAKGILCVNLSTPCTEHTGACCDRRIASLTARCLDDVPESQCIIDDPNQVSWTKGTRCADLNPACSEHTGACCDRRIASPTARCRDDVPASQCIIDDPTQVTWTKDTLCADLNPACTEHTGACCDRRIASPTARCRDDVPQSQCVIDDPTQVSWTKGVACADLDPLCTEHTGACCDRRIASPTARCLDDVPQSQCVIDDPTQVSWTKGVACADLDPLCSEHTGACCDRRIASPTARCLDDVPQSLCVIDDPAQVSWTKGTRCADLNPACTEHTGACCDASQPNGQCRDDIAESQCNPTGDVQITWTKGVLCADLMPVCSEHTGACCNAAAPNGSCADGVPESQCNPTGDPQITWVKGVLCLDLNPPCREHTGACCNAAVPGGSCTDGIAESLCNPTGDPQITWVKGILCANLSTPCIEHTGACCDRRFSSLTARCRDNVPESQCIIDDPTQVSWTKDMLCADLNPACTEHTGACCDRRIASPTARCRDDVPESQCIIDDPTQKSWTKGVDCVDLDPLCTEHTGACCDRRIADPAERCRENVPESLCIIDDPDQVSWHKGSLCVGAAPLCLEHTGACCDRRIAGPTGRCRDDIPESLCIIDDPAQVSWTKGVACADLDPLCTEHTGACCDRRIASPTARCRDNVPESLCIIDDPNQVSWTKDTLCADLNPACTEHIGACCDASQPNGLCRDGIAESLCNPTGDVQIRWAKDVLCADLNPPCTEHTGACCNADAPGGSCVDNVPQSQCNTTGDPQITWIKGTLCANMNPPCREHTGACCNAALPGGSCADDVPESECNPTNDPQITWAKGILCENLSEPCREHTGACCDRRIASPTARCRDNVPESQCIIDDPIQVSWTKATLCADLNPACSEHTGACCDRRIADPATRCRDDVPESLCVIDDPIQKSWAKGVDCADLDPLCTEHTGACCNAAVPGGSCQDDVPESQCNPMDDPQITWTKGTLCADLDPACTEHTGACCDHAQTGGTCVDDVPGSECTSGASAKVYEADPNLPIPKLSSISHTIPVPDTGIVQDVDVDLVINHTWVGDLCVTLSHGGTDVVLIQRPGGALPCDATGCCGCAADNYDIILNDEALGGPIETQCTDNLTGSFTPENPLSPFDGMDKNGNWTLTVSDNAGADFGTLVHWSLHFINATNEVVTQPEYFKGMTCAEVEAAGDCREHTGACCDASRPGGGCTDNVPESLCNPTNDPQIRWAKDILCADLNPPCEEHTGACCDATQPSGLCRNGIAESQCNPTNDPQIRWAKDVLCSQLNPPCTEHTGACCDADAIGGSCVDSVPESQCNPTNDPQITWVKDVLCLNMNPPCREHTGACCNAAAPGGSCVNDVPESVCNPTGDPQITWTKGILCENLSEPCAEHTGACCDRRIDSPTTRCRDDVPQSLCVIDDPTQVSWTKGVDCADLDPQCTEHTGACCDASQPGGVCTDDVAESLCNPTNNSQIVWTKGMTCDSVGCEGHVACCDFGLVPSCTKAPESECISAWPIRPGPSGSDCTAPQACCAGGGRTISSCQMLDPVCCSLVGGVPAGEGSVCSAPEACCVSQDGNTRGGFTFCVELAPVCCDLRDGKSSEGTPQGPGTSCTDPTDGCCTDQECEDNIACTLDRCELGVCVYDPDHTLCPDDTNVCTRPVCDPVRFPATGCGHVPVEEADPTRGDFPCDDGNACTVGDHCMVGMCIPGTPRVCPDDGFACTNETCDPAEGCVSTRNDAKCDDDNECTRDICCVGLLCELPVGADGCKHSPLGTAAGPPVPCDDGLACTTADRCVGPTCTGGAPPNCDDADPCTLDKCVEPVGCRNNCETTPPTITCPDDVFVQCNGPGGVPVGDVPLEAEADDACGPVTITDNKPAQFYPPSCPGDRPTVVTFTARDACNNPASCTVRVHVDGLACCPGFIDTELTLVAPSVDLRQETDGPVTTKATFDIWNQDERRFSETRRCITCWDSTLLGFYGPTGQFRKTTLHTDKAKARVNGLAASECGPTSVDAPLLGVVVKELTFPGRFDDILRSAITPVGTGTQTARIRHDLLSESDSLLLSSVDKLHEGVVGVRFDAPAEGYALPNPAELPRIPQAGVPGGRISITNKGSILYYPRVQVRWNAAGELIEDTFIDLANDFPEGVDVMAYMINGDAPLEAECDPACRAQFGDACRQMPDCVLERAHPGWNKVGVQFAVTANQPTYWSAATGQPAGVLALGNLDPGDPVGRPDLDPRNPGGRIVRAFVVAWAVKRDSKEINWNHLVGDAIVIHYVDSTAFEYNAWAVQCVADVATGAEPDGFPGILNLNGVEYQFVPDMLVFDFYTVGSNALSNQGP